MSRCRFLAPSSRLLLPVALCGVLLAPGCRAPAGGEAAPSDAQAAAETAPTLQARLAERERFRHVLRRTDDLLALVRTARLVGMPLEEDDSSDWGAHRQGVLRELLVLDARWRSATWEGMPQSRLEAMVEGDVVIGSSVETRLPELEQLIDRFEERLLEWGRDTAAAGG